MADDIVGANVVGAALPEQQTEARAMLDGLGEEVVVTVFNPLPQPFRVQYARSFVQQPPLNKQEQFARERAGLDTSKEQNPQQHTTQYLILGSGESKNLPGDIAQIAVRQLVTYIISARYAGKATKPIADPFERSKVEKEVVVKVVDSTQFMNSVDTPAPQAATEVVEKENVEPPTSHAKPPKAEETPKVTDSTKPDPAPGQGLTYDPGISF